MWQPCHCGQVLGLPSPVNVRLSHRQILGLYCEVLCINAFSFVGVSWLWVLEVVVSEKISVYALSLECLQNDNSLPKEVNLSILQVEKVRCSREDIKRRVCEKV